MQFLVFARFALAKVTALGVTAEPSYSPSATLIVNTLRIHEGFDVALLPITFPAQWSIHMCACVLSRANAQWLLWLTESAARPVLFVALRAEP